MLQTPRVAPAASVSGAVNRLEGGGETLPMRSTDTLAMSGAKCRSEYLLQVLSQRRYPGLPSHLFATLFLLMYAMPPVQDACPGALTVYCRNTPKVGGMGRHTDNWARADGKETAGWSCRGTRQSLRAVSPGFPVTVGLPDGDDNWRVRVSMALLLARPFMPRKGDA